MKESKPKLVPDTEAEDRGTDRPNLVSDGFVTVTEAAGFLNISKTKVYLMMDSGELIYAKFGKSRRIPRRAIMEFAQGCLRQAQ